MVHISWIQRNGYNYILPASLALSHHARKTIMSDNDCAGFSYSNSMNTDDDYDYDDDDDVMVTMNNCETTALASLSFLFSLWPKKKNKNDSIKKSVM